MDAFLGLGSNLGDRIGYLERAINALDKNKQIEVREQSPIYETAAVGYTNQPDFLNMVIRITTSLAPEALLKAALAIEKELGRTREVKWGPRTLDIDILFYGRLIIRNENLTVPHPSLPDRAFVLFPLRDIAANWVHPVSGLTIREMGEQVAGKEGVRLWEKPSANDYVHFENLKT